MLTGHGTEWGIYTKKAPPHRKTDRDEGKRSRGTTLIGENTHFTGTTRCLSRVTAGTRQTLLCFHLGSAAEGPEERSCHPSALHRPAVLCVMPFCPFRFPVIAFTFLLERVYHIFMDLSTG